MVSTTHCSSRSRKILRTGITKKDAEEVRLLVMKLKVPLTLMSLPKTTSMEVFCRRTSIGSLVECRLSENAS